jgi:predicted ester cyclase
MSNIRRLHSAQEEMAMSTETNKAIVRRRVEEGINQANGDVVLSLLSPDAVDHSAQPGTPQGRAGWNLGRKLFRTAFPDGRWAIAEMVAEHQLVVTRATFSGTHRGAFMGLPPTGRRVQFESMYICRLDNDTIVERWVSSDQLGLLRQLGAIPTPEQVAG